MTSKLTILGLLKPITDLLGEVYFWWGNRRSAWNFIRSIERLGCVPQTLVDLGANNSQFARYLVARWPALRVLSFEPQFGCSPLGVHFQLAAHEFSGAIPFVTTGKQSHTSESGDLVPCVRVDSALKLCDLGECVIKVDCENSTLEALKGCAGMLGQVRAVHVEMMNDHATDPQFKNRQAEIYGFMFAHGFNHVECVNAAVCPRNVDYYDAVFTRQ